MKARQFVVRMTAMFLTLTASLLLAANSAMAHCDSMDGPIVKDAQRALAEKNIDPVLKWVRAEDEAPIRTSFAMTLAVRRESEAAKELADRFFFETLVRMHRAAEGEAFTGLKPAGQVDPAIAAADRALADGEIDRLADKYAAAVRAAIEHRFAEAHARRQAAEKSVEQGRQYVAAYVQFTHFVEAVDQLVAERASHQHGEDK